jgi:hypothetical protein
MKHMVLNWKCWVYALVLPLCAICLVSCTYRLPDVATQPAPVITQSLPTTLEHCNPTPELPTETVIPATPQSLPSQRTQYQLEAVLNYVQHHLAVTETITYTNTSDDSLNELVLMVESNRYLDTFQLNKIESVKTGPIQDYVLKANQLKIPLPQPLESNQTIQLEMEYELFLPSPTPNPNIRPIPFGYTARQTNLVDWYPFIAPYRAGQGWLAHDPGFFGEHLAYESSDFQVDLRIEDAMPYDPLLTPTTTPSSSKFRPLIIAASSIPSIEDKWYRYRLENARNFAWSASREYVVKQQMVGNVQVLGYAFLTHAQAGDAALDATAKALGLYSDIFGPYPHTTLSVVEADFLDGMEYDGLYFLSNGFYNLYTGKPADYLTAIAAHETAHQWWYGIVGNDQALHPWLDEALCTYSERLFYEKFYPQDLDWWWEYRINYYKPKGWINSSIYSFNYTTDAYRAYRDAVYLNGALFLENLRKLIGDEAFFAFLKDYTHQLSGKIASDEDFITILQSHVPSGVDLQPLLNQYFMK